MALNGQTGTITEVWPVRALVRIKQLEADVAFGTSVVSRHDGSRPASLQDMFKVGSMVHYNAEPDSACDHGYRITKVWPAGGSKQSGAAPPSGGAKYTSSEKFLKSQLKAMLRVNPNFSMQLQSIHKLCVASKPCNAHVYKNTLDGLRAFIAERPKHFCLRDNRVTLIEKGNEATPICAPASDKVLKRQLKVMLNENPGPLLLDQIHLHLQRSKPNMVAAYKGTVSGLKSFVVARPTVFKLDGNALSRASESDAGSGVPDDFAIEKAVAVLRKMVGSRGQINLESLMNLLVGCDYEVSVHVGHDTTSLREFLQSQNDTFYVTPQGSVSLYDTNIREIEKVIRQGMDGPGTPAPHNKAQKAPTVKPKKSAAAATNHVAGAPDSRPPRPVAPITKSSKGTHMDSLNFIRNILKSNGPLPVSKLVGHLSNTTVDIRDYVGGGTAQGLLNFVKHQSDVFEVNQLGVCSVQDGQAGGADGVWQREVLAKRDGVVQHTVKGVCGFIQNGQFNHDNIYFKPAVVVRDFESLDSGGVGRLGLGLGDSADCLYELYLSKSCKYRALGVWPTNNAQAFAGADSAIFLKTVAVIDAPVLQGQGEVNLLMDGMGFVMVRTSDKPDKMIIFHMQHVGYEPKSTWDILAEGSQVLYVAVYQYTKKAPETPPLGSTPTEVWHAIHLWPMSVRGSAGIGEPAAALTTDCWEGEAVVRELTCDGGCLSFGKDPWSERVSFTWKDLAARRGASRGPQLISPGDVLVGVARASPELTAIKWVATDLLTRDEPAAIKRMRVNGFQRVDPIQPQVRRSNSFGIGALSDFLSGGAPMANEGGRAESVTGDQVSRSSSSSRRSEDKNLLDLLTDDLDGLCFTDEVKVDASNGPRHTVTDKTDPQLPSNVNDNRFIKEALDASTLYLVKEKGGAGAAAEPEDRPTPIVDGSGKVVATSIYGGVLESSVGRALVYFGAHVFHLDQSPVAHTAFASGTRVRFDASYSGSGNFLASAVWIGKKPL